MKYNIKLNINRLSSRNKTPKTFLNHIILFKNSLGLSFITPFNISNADLMYKFIINKFYFVINFK